MDGWFDGVQYERIVSLFKAKMTACKTGEPLTPENIEEILTKERSEEDKVANEIENDEHQYDSDLGNQDEDETQAGEEFANKLDESEKSLSDNIGISKSHNEVTSVDDASKIQDLFGYVLQNAPKR